MASLVVYGFRKDLGGEEKLRELAVPILLGLGLSRRYKRREGIWQWKSWDVCLLGTEFERPYRRLDLKLCGGRDGLSSQPISDISSQTQGDH